MPTISGVYGLDIPTLFHSVLANIEDRGSTLYDQILALTAQQTGGTGGTSGTGQLGTADSANSESATSSISQEQMLLIQFEIGQYNAMVEMLSSVSKSLTDMMKTLAQRSS